MQLHNLADAMKRADFPSSGKLGLTPEGHIFGWGTTVPSSEAGYAPSALFIHTSGAAGSRFYVNQGTKATSNFLDVADVGIADAGSLITATSLEGALQELAQHNLTTQAFIPLPLINWREVAANDIQTLISTGGIMAKDSNPIYEHTNGDTDSAHRFRWVAGDVNPITIQHPLSPDFDTSANLELHLRIGMSGSTDTPAMDLDTFFNEGDTKVSDASAALSSTLGEVVITIAAADIPSGAQTVSLELTPQAHGTDAIHMTASWLEHTRKLLTA